MPASNPFGILDFLAWDHDWNDHHYPLTKVQRAVQLMKEAGVGCVRIDFLWSDLEPARGQFDFSRYDAIVDCVVEQKLEILGLLNYNPAWRNVLWNTAPIPADYENYARATVGHFKGRVGFWEVWNEPDHPVYWQPQDDLQAYSRLLKRSYPVIKESDPGCRVLMGGLAHVQTTNLERLYAQIGAGSFDIVNIHPFVSPLKADALGILRGMVDHTRVEMERHGDGSKPIWITELGCPGSPTDRTWWLGKSPSEQEQASWTAAVYASPLEWRGVEKIFWAFFRDTPNHFKDAVDHFGLVREDFTLKPSYHAYQAAARHFATHRPLGR